MKMNVQMGVTTVAEILNVLILLAAIHVNVILATLAMENPAKCSKVGTIIGSLERQPNDLSSNTPQNKKRLILKSETCSSLVRSTTNQKNYNSSNFLVFFLYYGKNNLSIFIRKCAHFKKMSYISRKITIEK